jgi:hypothetical protein
MAGVKRTRDGAPNDKKKPESDSPYIPMFETFRAELDEHHDRRERIVKTSRDITAQSKKMYGRLPSPVRSSYAVKKHKINKKRC